jgi:hypothetical protein
MKSKLFFPLSYSNVDIYYIELDSIKNENEFIDKLNQVKKSLNTIINREYIILHIEESKITNKVFDEIISFISIYKNKMKRFGIVGAHGFLSLKMKKHMKSINDLESYFCNDLQKAKDIIVGLIRK